MKQLKYSISVLFLILVGACTTTPEEQAEIAANEARYVFGELESLSSISNWSLDGWRVVDERSLIVNTSPSRYYLLVLTRSNPELKFANAIIVSSSSARVQVKFDTVATARSPMVKTSIERIYKLEGKDQIDEITARIVGE